MRLTLLTTSLLSAFAVGACAAPSDDEASASEDAIGASSSLTLPINAGGTATTRAIVGTSRTASNLLPANRQLRCGNPRSASRGADNFAYVEVKNPNDTAASVNVRVDGPQSRFAAIYAYASREAPTTASTADACLTASDGNTPELSAAKGNALVVPARGSAYVLVATGSVKGTYTIQATVERFASAESALLELPVVGNEVEAATLIGGTQRTAKNMLPDQRSFVCGARPAQFRGGVENFSWVEVKNASPEAKLVRIDLETAQKAQENLVALFAYRSAEPPTTVDAARGCMISDDGYGTSQPNAALEPAAGSGLVVPGSSSVYVMIAARHVTGPVTVHARVDAAGIADRAKIRLEDGLPDDADLLVSGASRAPEGALPDLERGFRCGARRSASRPLDNFGWVEIENPSGEAATVEIDVEGPRDGKIALFAYASATPPTTTNGFDACLVSDGRTPAASASLSSARGNALVVPAHGSSYVLVASQRRTGAYHVKTNVLR